MTNKEYFTKYQIKSVYKIHDMDTNNYCIGGADFLFSKKGKVWELKELRQSLSLVLETAVSQLEKRKELEFIDHCVKTQKRQCTCQKIYIMKMFLQHVKKRNPENYRIVDLIQKKAVTLEEFFGDETFDFYHINQ